MFDSSIDLLWQSKEIVAIIIVALVIFTELARISG